MLFFSLIFKCCYFAGPIVCPNHVTYFEFPDWTNCSSYYTCTFGLLSKSSCPSGLYYDFFNWRCAYRHQTTCFLWSLNTQTCFIIPHLNHASRVNPTTLLVRLLKCMYRLKKFFKNYYCVCIKNPIKHIFSSSVLKTQITIFFSITSPSFIHVF